MPQKEEYVDWLGKVRNDGGEFAWIRGTNASSVNYDRKTREQLIQTVLNSLNVKNAVKSIVDETGQSEQELWKEANEIMQNMAHSFGLTSTKAVGYLVLKCLMRLLDKVMVNLDALKQLREVARQNPVVFMPTHRTYVDFLLISLLCYDQDLKLPAICAGADFLTSKYVGEALRRCGAFFIRRSFGSDRLYWTLFTEYVQTHITGNESPIEFFVEGQRSRTSKSLYPRFGLVQVIAEPFLRSHVYDTVVIPVTINYDRLLESFLYGRELLGSPKPKETVSGLLKVRQILNQKFGSVFITFAEPISLRQYFAHIDRASISFRPTAHYIYERSVKNTVAHLAHEVVHVQNKNNVLTIWPLMAAIIQQQLQHSEIVDRHDVLAKLNDLYDLCLKLRLNIWGEQRDLENTLNYYLNDLFKDLFELSDNSLRIRPADAEKSTSISEEILRDAIPAVVLANAANPLIYLLSDFGFVLIVCQSVGGNVKMHELKAKFEFLREIFEKEFVHKPFTAQEDLKNVLDLLEKAEVLRVENDHVTIESFELADCITQLVDSFLHAYSEIMAVVIRRKLAHDKNALQICWKELTDLIRDPDSRLNLAHLSSDLIKNVISFVAKNNDKNGNNQHGNKAKLALNALNDIIKPSNENAIRSRI